jgi:hypothetical protein
MAYVPGFTSDLFISYRHLDNRHPTEGWVGQLHAYLAGRLPQLLDSDDIQVWRDPRLDGLDVLDEVLEREVRQSAMLLVVLSPGYARSDWCARERRAYLDSRNGSTTVDGKSCVVRATKTPLGDVRPPADVETGTLGFEFFERTTGGTFTEFSANPGAATHARFSDRCEAMSQAVAHVLRKLRAAAEAARRKSAPRTVFVAEVTKGARPFRDSICRELEDKGFVVTRAAVDLAAGADELREELRRQLAGCMAALHVLGRSFGPQPGGQPPEARQSLDELQFRTVETHAATVPGFVQALWIPDAAEDFEAPQLAWIDRVRYECEYLTGPAPKVRDELTDLLNRTLPAAPVATAIRSIYLLCDRPDLLKPELQALRNWLVDHCYPTDLPVFQGDVARLRELEEQSIIESRATLIFYGSAEDQWVRLKRRAVQNAWAKGAIANGTATSPPARAVYLAAPEDDLKQAHYRGFASGRLLEADIYPPLLVLGNCGAFDPGQLQPLIDALATPEGGR